MKKLEMVKGGFELLVSTGVSILVGSMLTSVKPSNLGVIKKMAVGAGSFAISMFAVDKVTDHIDNVWDETATQIKEIFNVNTEKEMEGEEA